MLNVIHDCFEQITQLGIENNEEIQMEAKLLLKKKDNVFKQIKELDNKKQLFIDANFYDINEIEKMKSVSYAQFKAWENDIVLINKILKKFQSTEPPSVYEKRGILTL